MLLPAGRPHDAVRILEVLPNVYVKRFSNPGFNVIASHFVKALMAALKVLADALMQTGATEHSSSFTFLIAKSRGESDDIYAGRIRADVEETDAIMTGYWEAMLDETRRELREQQRAAAVASGVPLATMTKSKAAKRKRQKRKV